MVNKLFKFEKHIIIPLLWIAGLIHTYPLMLIIISAVKTKKDLAFNPIGLPKEITFDHFVKAFKAMHYGQSLFNTVLITVITVIILIIFSSMAAYAITRRNNRFYNFLYIFFIAGLIVPFQMIMIPLYKTMLIFGFINTYHGIMILYIARFSPFSIFFLAGFVKTIPMELEHAALIDGCGIYKTFLLIVFPLLKPAIVTISILNTFNIWNDFIMAMLFLQKRVMMTLTVQLSSFQGMYSNDWSLIFAGICMIVLPMLLIFFLSQKAIIEGITAGAVKG